MSRGSNSKEYNHQYYLRNKEKFRLKSLKWAKKNKKKVRESNEKYELSNLEKNKLRKRKYYQQNILKIRHYYLGHKDKEKERREKRKLLVLAHYSNGEIKCACCKEGNIKFLSIDHINGGGNEHRKNEGISNIHWWLIKHKFPLGYQVLCYNCNMAKGFYGVCPHLTNDKIRAIIESPR